MIRKYVIPAFAMLGLFFALKTVLAGSAPAPIAEPISNPARAPYESYVAGAGVVEASSENIAIASPLSGVVERVHVVVGAEVKKGDALFSLDQREYKARRAIAQAALQVAEAELADARNSFEMRQKVSDTRAVSLEDLSKKKFQVQIAQAKRDEAQAQLQSAETDIERAVVLSPVDGKVLQVKVRVGEFAAAQVSASPLMVVGSIAMLHVRVDVDENDAWRVHANAKAQAFLRGNRVITTPLEFVRFEPYVVPKKSLTGESSERVDTRVLQILFRFNPQKLPIYVGQLMDVFIEDRAEATGNAVSNSAAAS